MRVCFSASDFDGPGSYRCGFVAQQLQRAGHTCLVPPFKRFPIGDGRERIMYSFRTVPPSPDADLYVAQMRKEPHAAEAFAQLRQWFGRVVVAECDDDYVNIPTYNAGYIGAVGVRKHLFDGFRNATCMTVSTPALANVYEKFNQNIHVLRNCLDWGMWEAAEQQSEVDRGGRVRVGWMGRLAWRRGDLKVLADVLPGFLKRNPHVDFVAAGSEDQTVHDLLGIPVDRRVTYGPVHFRQGGLVDITAVTDIGLVPLELNTFNEGKSHLKGMEYAACGIPCIASPTESYRDYWLKGREGEIGLLARWAKDWEEHLDLLVNDDDLRRKMGRQARLFAQENTIQEHYVQWETLYQKLVNANPVSDEHIGRACIAYGALQKLKEFTPLLTLARDLEPRVVVEIGSAKGGTLYGWCQLAHPDALIVSIDLPGGEFGGGMDEQQAHKVSGYAKPGQTMHFLPRDSHAPETLAALTEILAGRQIDLLMIDGDHTYEGVKADYDMYAPLVRDGGIIALHDVLPHPGFPSCEVDRLWAELKQDHRVIEFLEPDNHASWGQWGGIGVIRQALPVAA